jgi:fumarate hydratase class II
MIEGTELDERQLQRNVENSVMMVTVLSPVIGYDAAAAIAHTAMAEDLSLKEAALRSGSITEEDFDRLVVPEHLTHPG